MRGRAAVTTAAILLAACAARGEEVINRNVLTDETWTASSSPYIIEKSSVLVKNGSTLTIDPGVEVRFQPGTTIETDPGSSIVAIGSPGDSVRFTSNSGTPAAGDWTSVTAYSSPASEFRRCVFSYGQYALSLTASEVPVTHCAFRDCVFGARVKDSNGTIDRCFFQGCDHGLWLVRSSPTIQGSWITGSANVGVLCQFIQSLPVIWRCNLFDNAGYNIQLDSYIEEATVTARENWWGSGNESEIRASIRDADDGYGDALVDYADWLTEVPVEASSWGSIKSLFRY